MKWLIPSLLLACIVIFVVTRFVDPKQNTETPPIPFTMNTSPQFTINGSLVRCGKLEYLPKSGTFDSNDKALQGCLFVGRTIIIQKDGTIWVEAR